MTDDRDHETPGEPAVEELPEDELVRRMQVGK